MSSPPSTSVLDRIPDEVLVQILSEMLKADVASDEGKSRDVVPATNPENVVPSGERQEEPSSSSEHCVDAVRFWISNRSLLCDWVAPEMAASTKRMVSTRNGDEERLRAHPTVANRMQDWHIINSTCRRFRRLGKQAFFAQKRLLLTPDIIKKLREAQTETLPDEEEDEEYSLGPEHQQVISATITEEKPKQKRLGTPWHWEKWVLLNGEDHRLVLEEARDIILLGTRLTTPSVLLGLPKMLSALPKLRSCWLMLSHDAAATFAESFKVHRAGIGSEHRISVAATELRGLLVDIGLPDIDFGFALGASYQWDTQVTFLKNQTFEMLRVKKGMMERGLKTPSEEFEE